MTEYSRYTEFAFDPADRDRVLGFWQEVGVPSARRQPGFVGAAILESAEASGRLRSFTVWESQQAFDAYYASPEHKELGAAIKGSGLSVVGRDGLKVRHRFGPQGGILRLTHARIDPAKRDALAAYWRDTGGPVLRRQPGCLAAEAWVEGDQLITAIRWRNAEDADRFRASAEHRAFGEAMAAAGAAVTDRQSLEPLD